jgi:GT2 family glycosyltransferase/glycosyltransferase involved in cell wall biosynthesis
MSNLISSVVRKIYYWLPLSQTNKASLKVAIRSKFPTLFTGQPKSTSVNLKSRKGRVLRSIYQKLPLSTYYKYRVTNIIFKTFPFLFRQLPEFQRWSSLTEKSARPWDALLALNDNVLQTKPINIPISLKPRISVIIPVYGKIDYTLMCLRSIAQCSIQVPFEVIVVDDCSPDNTLEVLKEVFGLRVVCNETNQGFIRSCNAGAGAARGEYLCFLNNDTQVCDGWLDELIRTFDDFPDVGLAGSRLVYPNGKLQEAGGIIWRDGSAWNFGRNADPCDPVFNYTRQVDYISGASILIKKKLFDTFGGFDELYLPAYCEDSDLALKVRNSGLKVMYQPLSVVVHYEGVTSGTDVRQGVKAYQIENSNKLFERWQELLKANEAPGGNVDRAKDRNIERRVLVLDVCTPTPDRDAGSVTVFNLLLLLRQMNFQVTFIPTGNFSYLSGYTQNLQRAGIEVLYAPYVTSVKQHVKKSGGRYDLVFMFRPSVAQEHLKIVRNNCPKAKILYHTVDLHYLRMMREAEVLGGTAKMQLALKMKQVELDIIREADASIVHSTAELELLRAELPNALIKVFPLIMEVSGSDKSFEARQDIVFIGGYQHPPNIDAVLYFASEVMPILRKRLSGVRFYAVGSNPPTEILDLACADVIVTGYIKDLNPLLDQMRVSVAPLRYGAGIKGKIGTAMVVGLPTVATTLAAEGMSLTHNENILVADGAKALAESIARLYEDESLWDSLSHNGLAFAEKTWGGEAAWSTLSNILENIGLTTKRDAHPVRLLSSKNVSNEEVKRPLLPLSVCRTKAEYQQLLLSDSLKQISALESDFVEQAKNSESFAITGICIPCSKRAPFLVDKQSGAQQQDGFWIPNWRERLECPDCKMNNRQRLIASLIKQHLQKGGLSQMRIYFMEQVTPIYTWATSALKEHQIIGSEYLGYEYKGGAIVNEIRHEDVMALSFEDESIDLIVSNDVFEHIPEPARAFRECARVLKPGGIMLATIPFHWDLEVSVPRALLDNGELINLLPPIYHGNPVSSDGSIVFTDFGWDILTEMNKCGFDDALIEVYGSPEHGHLGGGQIVFRSVKKIKVQ